MPPPLSPPQKVRHKEKINLVLDLNSQCLAAQDNLGVKKSLGPLKKPLEIADYVFSPHKNNLPHD
jgi:hypothetical protein